MRNRTGIFAAGLILVVATPALGAGTGSGFVINQDGYIITNKHVVTERFRDKKKNVWERECKRLHVKSTAIRGPARIVGRDRANDLAVIKTGSIGKIASVDRDRPKAAVANKRPVGSGMRSLGEELADRSQPLPTIRQVTQSEPQGSASGVLRFAARSVTPGQNVNLFGFPLGERVSSQMKVTRGIVVSTMGLDNNSNVIQIDAAVNPGNSGGPLLDGSGNVVGIAVSLLEGTQGFNFPVNATVAKQLMDSLNVSYDTMPSTNSVSAEEQYKRVRPYVVLITCY